MLSKLSEIAPLAQWGWVLLATALLLGSFVAYGHFKVVRQAYMRRFHGILAPFMLETMMRWAAILLLSGLLSWGMSLDWPWEIRGALATGAGAVLLVELAARTRGAPSGGTSDPGAGGRERAGAQSESSSAE